MLTHDGEELITASELARRLNVDRSAIRRYEQTGKAVPYSTEYRGLRRVLLFRASDVERIKQMRRGETGTGNNTPTRSAALPAF